MPRHRSFSFEFKRQVVSDFLEGRAGLPVGYLVPPSPRPPNAAPLSISSQLLLRLR
jgi:hypothetical protein